MAQKENVKTGEKNERINKKETTIENTSQHHNTTITNNIQNTNHN